MNNSDFKQHLINILLDIGVRDYEKRIYVVTPIKEEKKGYAAMDDIMRLCVLPMTRKVSFEELLKMFTMQEGYYPCWVDITKIEDEIYMNTSLRMRKAEDKDDGRYYPFRVRI